jgi:hypothetical protein
VTETGRGAGAEWVTNTGRMAARLVGLAGGMLDWLRECFRVGVLRVANRKGATLERAKLICV